MKRADALIPLSREHHTALLLALRIDREVPVGDDAAVQAVFGDLIAFWGRGLLPHFRAENECLLARLVRHLPMEDEVIRRTQHDHLGIEALVVSMRDQPALGFRRQALTDFAATLRAHIRWEEDVLFGAVEKQLTAEELAALGADVGGRLGEGETGAKDVWPALMKRSEE